MFFFKIANRSDKFVKQELNDRYMHVQLYIVTKSNVQMIMLYYSCFI